MEISRKVDVKTVSAPAEYFTGKVTITGQFNGVRPSRSIGMAHEPYEGMTHDVQPRGNRTSAG